MVAFSSTDPTETKARIHRLLNCTHRMTVLDRERPFVATVEHVSIAGLGLLSESYGPSVEIACDPPVRRFSVCLVGSGRMLVSHAGGDTVTADAHHGFALSYDRPVGIRRSPGVRQVMLSVDKARMEDYLQRLLCGPLHDSLRFDTSVDLGGSGQGIASAVTTVRHALAACGKAGPPPVLAAEIEHTVMAAMLFGQHSNYTEAIFSAAALPSPRVVRRVVELVQATPQEAFSAAGLAAFAGVSERSLYEAFRRRLGISPMAYVRQVRLERAHEDLLALEATATTTVTSVALRYGFGHMGRFAAAYRARFGESPSTTLHR